MNGVTVDHANALLRITSQFVESVQKPMLNKYIEMQNDVAAATMINTLLTKYWEQREQADEEEFSNICNYLKDHCNRKTTILSKSCLNHSDEYKTVIIDILQGKAGF